MINRLVENIKFISKEMHESQRLYNLDKKQKKRYKMSKKEELDELMELLKKSCKDIEEEIKEKKIVDLEPRMDFIEYMESKGVDTEEYKMKDFDKGMFNFKDAVGIALRDILEEKSYFYKKMVFSGIKFDFSKAVIITDSEKARTLKELIQPYEKELDL